MQRVVRAFPVLPGKEAAVRKFAAELRAPDRGVSNPSEVRRLARVLVLPADPERAGGDRGHGGHRPSRQHSGIRIAAANSPFDAWFRSGPAPRYRPGAGAARPPTTCIYDWSQ